MTRPNKYRHFIYFLLLLIPGSIWPVSTYPPLKGKTGNKNVLILEIRGMTYEMLERAYAPNLKYLIKNGFLASTRYINPEEPVAPGQRGAVRRKLGRMVLCYDSLRVFQSSLNTVGVFSDTIRGPFTLLRKNFRSNESMVKDFINNSNGSNVRFSFLSFRTFLSKQNHLERDQINELTTIDSLIGIVFKSYQEKVKWDQTTVMVLTDGTAGHKYQSTELYKNTPIIIKGPGIPVIQSVETLVTSDDLLALANNILEVSCQDPVVPGMRDFLAEMPNRSDSTITYRPHFVSRPDILVYPIRNRNMLELELLADNDNAVIYYSLDSTDPRVNGIEYKNLVPIKDAGVYFIRAATNYNGVWSSVTQQKVTLRHNLANIEIDPQPDAKYYFDGIDELVDGDTAGLDFAVDKWLGFQGKDVNFLFSFGSKREIHSIDISVLQDYISWIFLPKKITVLVGDDRNHMVELGSQIHESNADDEKNIRKHFVFHVEDSFLQSVSSNLAKKKKRKRTLQVKYLQIKVEAQKTAPEWFSLPGAQVWFFTDEIKIE